MIAANVGTWERSCASIVDAGLEALGCQNEIYLIVNLPIRGMLGYCPRQLVGMKKQSKQSKRSATLNSWKGPRETEEDTRLGTVRRIIIIIIITVFSYRLSKAVFLARSFAPCALCFLLRIVTWANAENNYY